MEEVTRSHKGRLAIRAFKTTADALALRGFYKPAGASGKTLEKALRTLSPEIYGSMNDPRSIELKGLEYVLDRLPKGLEECFRIVLTAQEELENTSFEKIQPPKRRRISYRVSEKEICFVITRGLSEIYDILTHLTFLNIEAMKIQRQMKDRAGNVTEEWKALEKILTKDPPPEAQELDRALWNLSILLGRTYHETKELYDYLEKGRMEDNSNNGLFKTIHSLGCRADASEQSRENELLVYFTPSLMDLIGHHEYGRRWALDIKEKLCELGLVDRPLHIISANMHSVVNTLYAFAAMKAKNKKTAKKNLYDFIHHYRHKDTDIRAFGAAHGFYELPDRSGTHIDCQIIDTALLKPVPLHPDIRLAPDAAADDPPVILVIDYAFGTQAFEVMDELLFPFDRDGASRRLNVRSISVMGKAGILPGKKGDIMLATSHVMEGTPHNYIFENDLCKEDFDDGADVYIGPIVTVLGTSLQNRDVLEKFQTTSWKAVGLEMEGGHYQRAIGAAIIRGHISDAVRVRYAYYASDNPLASGQTLASGSMGGEGIRPTYMITKVILEKIFSTATSS